MKLTGTRLIAAPADIVWAGLNDPEVLKACIPGCQTLEKTSDTSFEAVVKQKVGPVSATFKGAVELSDMNPPHSYRIAGEGKGGAAGFAKGGADVSLKEQTGGDTGLQTELTYDVDAKVGGKIAQLGARLIDGFAKKMADQFFTKFQDVIEGAGKLDEAAAGTADAPTPEAAKKGWLKRLVS
ncbi:MAG: carbon monoxide dehydrogenase subunit G [Pseudomonadota bacterium]